MSAPKTSDPIAVMTKDGAAWLRRVVTGEGRGLYAVDGSCACPEYLMATLAELAEHGIAGMADALPMPVGPEPELAEDRERVELLAGFERALSPFCSDPKSAAAAVASVRDPEVEWLLRDAQRLQDRVVELEFTVQQMCDALNGRECPPPGETPMETVTRFAVRLMEAERQLAELDALELGDLDGRRSACCGRPNHPTWLRKTEDTRACPWCVMDLQSESLVARTHQLARYQEIERNFWANQRTDQSLAAVANLRIAELNEERDALKARVVELEAERTKYVGKEPTIAEEMAYLSRCIDAVLDLCNEAEREGITSGGSFTVEAVRRAADGLVERRSYPPALPWAALMDDEDLHDFLDELAASAITHASNAKALAEVEATCGRWRLIAEAQHAHNTAPGPSAEESADRWTAFFAPTQAYREETQAAGVPCSKCGAPVHWVKSSNSDGGFWRHSYVPGRVLDHFGEVAESEGRHAFEKERLGESDAKRRLARCKHCGQDREAPMHAESGGAR